MRQPAPAPSTPGQSAPADPIPSAAPLDARPEGRYHSNQIAAHWLVASLVLLQFLTGEGMARAMSLGYGAGFLPHDGAIWVHGIFGTVILVTMLIRLSMRRAYGAPPPPETEPSAIKILSRGVHYTFYALLIAMPLFGIAAVFTLIEPLGTAHAWASKLLIALAVLHIAGALWHAFVKRDGIIKRMFSGQPAVVPER